jgi:hypothetical protein
MDDATAGRSGQEGAKDAGNDGHDDDVQGRLDAGRQLASEGGSGAKDGGTALNAPPGPVERDAASPAPVADSGARVPDAGRLSDAGQAELGDPEDAGPEGEQVSLETLLDAYADWTPLGEPVSISEEIYQLCRLPSLSEQAFADSEHGNSLALRYWLNDSAYSVYTSRSEQETMPAFPVGASIVKEKFAGSSSSRELTARAVMVKRAPGFAPELGDWEFGYWEPAAGLLAGEDENAYCGGCHAAASDYVFLDQSWRTP